MSWRQIYLKRLLSTGTEAVIGPESGLSLLPDGTVDSPSQISYWNLLTALGNHLIVFIT